MIRDKKVTLVGECHKGYWTQIWGDQFLEFIF